MDGGLSKLDLWLEKHDRLDRIYWSIHFNTVRPVRYALHQRRIRKDLRPFKPGGFFLDHGTDPAIIYIIDEGLIRGVSLVTGEGVVSDVYACGPEPVSSTLAWDAAHKIREERNI